jgi:phytoene synthase
MDRRAPATIARACDLGVAMQLTNIARDVGEDARAGRLYLPLDWMEAAGVCADRWLDRPTCSPPIVEIVQRLLNHADAVYQRATFGIGELPLACRPAIHAARLIYAEIGREVGRQGYDSVTRRAVVSAACKLHRLAAAVIATASSPRPGEISSLPAYEFLIRAVTNTDSALPSARIVVSKLDDRVAWLVDLFDRLEHDHRTINGTVRRRPASTSPNRFGQARQSRLVPQAS